jgi:hypothetical protein
MLLSLSFSAAGFRPERPVGGFVNAFRYVIEIIGHLVFAII